MHAQIAQHALNREVAQETVAAVDLQASVDDLETDIGRTALRHRSIAAGVRRFLLHFHRSLPKEKTRRFQLRRIVCNLKPQRLKIRKPLPELLALAHVLDRAVETELRAADRASADVQAAAVETGHGDLEALPFLADEI